jgi:hypothetical protein
VLSSIGNTQNYLMITFCDPICRASTDPEVGITAKRMLSSLKRIIATGKTERHETVQALMGHFTFYQLRNNRAVPEEFKHPTYENPEIGAWALDDYREHSAECQAICRYVTAMLEQVGLPGAQVVVVWADPLDMKAKEAAYGEGGLRRVSRTVEESYEIEEDVVVPIELGFFDKFSGKPTEQIERRKKTATKKITQYAYLTTSKPTVGQNAEPCGLNLYEACLKFTDENAVIRYYGGGTGDHFFKTKSEVVGAFHSLIWIANEKNPAYTPPSYEEKLSGKINLHAAPPTLRFCCEIVYSWRK